MINPTLCCFFIIPSFCTGAVERLRFVFSGEKVLSAFGEAAKFPGAAAGSKRQTQNRNGKQECEGFDDSFHYKRPP